MMKLERLIEISAAAAAALAVLAPGFASADAPSRLVGTIADFHGKYQLVVRDERGRLTDVTLRPGTIITPRGLRLERGMQVTVLGQAAERAFAAGEIDTAYQLPPTRNPFQSNNLADSNGARGDSGTGQRGDSVDRQGNPPLSTPSNRPPR